MGETKEVWGIVCSVLQYPPQSCQYLMFSEGLLFVFQEALHIWGNLLPIGKMRIKGDARKDALFVATPKSDRCV